MALVRVCLVEYLTCTHRPGVKRDSLEGTETFMTLAGNPRLRDLGKKTWQVDNNYF